MLGIQGGKNASFYALLLCAIIAMACRLQPEGKTFMRFFKENLALSFAMTGTVIAIALHDAYVKTANSRIYDMPSRLAMFALISWALMLLPARKLRVLAIGMSLGAMVGATALAIATAGGHSRPAVVFAMPIIPFGNLTFLMGVLAVISTGIHRSAEKKIVALKVMAGCASLWGVYLSQTRGAWLVFVAIFVAWLTMQKRISRRQRLGILLAVSVFLFGLYFSGDILRARIVETYSDLNQYFNGENLDTSLGIRIQLWKASWMIFKEYPLFGIGVDHYTDGLAMLASKNVITPQAATFHHAHNDVLFSMATLGIAGLLALLCLYIVPAALFLKNLGDPDKEVRTVAEMGFVLVLSFFVFGLTEVMFFYWTSNHSFYSFAMAGIYAHLIKRKLELQSGKIKESVFKE